VDLRRWRGHDGAKGRLSLAVNSAAVSGFGMALLYPNLSAAIADQIPPEWRGSAIGI